MSTTNPHSREAIEAAARAIKAHADLWDAQSALEAVIDREVESSDTEHHAFRCERDDENAVPEAWAVELLDELMQKREVRA